MKTFVCNKCHTRVCVCAFDDYDKDQPYFCTVEIGERAEFHPVTEKEDPENAKQD